MFSTYGHHPYYESPRRRQRRRATFQERQQPDAALALAARLQSARILECAHTPEVPHEHCI